MPPRSSIRQTNATPARSTRATSTALRETPNARRSSRAASRQPLAAKDVVSNPALPEVQTQQSYAYGSSQLPALPEQLRARDMSMYAVANRLNDAAEEAERNFEARAAEVRDSTPESQASARNARAQKRASRATSQKASSQPLQPETPDDVRKQDRVAAWVDSSQLDDIQEEDSRQESLDREPETPIQNRADSEPSSFPTGSFNHSYNYERGERGPDLPYPQLDPIPESEVQPERQTERKTPPLAQPRSLRTPTTSLLHRTGTKMRSLNEAAARYAQHAYNAILTWISRMIQVMQKSILELPDSPATSIVFKSLLMIAVLSISGLTFCTIFTYTCDSSSTSVVSQSLQRFCGQCGSGPLPQWNLSTTDPNDINSLLAALKHTQSRILQIEARLNSRIDSSHASQVADAASLRTQQEALETQIRRLHQRQPSHGMSADDVPSPLIAKVNFFSVSSGATIIPYLTSPTRTQHFNFPYRLALRMLGLRKTLSPPPITALEPWQDEGECWCAADTPTQVPKSTSDSSEDQTRDVMRLAVQTSQQIYPTELVVEHFPSTGSLQPGTAPRNIELWADFADLTYEEWSKLHIKDLIADSPLQPFLSANNGAKTWARIGTATYAISSTFSSHEGPYEMSADESFGTTSHRSRKNTAGGKGEDVRHVQRFNLNINQHGGLLHYSNRFLVRVKNNHGADYTCLYRVRLHGVPRHHERQGEED